LYFCRRAARKGACILLRYRAGARRVSRAPSALAHVRRRWVKHSKHALLRQVGKQGMDYNEQ
jgi:hypothetical protein